MRYKETVGATNYGFILDYRENFGFSYTVEDAVISKCAVR